MKTYKTAFISKGFVQYLKELCNIYEKKHLERRLRTQVLIYKLPTVTFTTEELNFHKKH